MSDLEAAVAAGVLGADEAHRALLQATVEVARAIYGAKAASVFLLDEEADELVFEAVAGEGEGELVGMRFPADTGIAGWVLTTRQPLIVDDLSADTRWSRTAGSVTLLSVDCAVVRTSSSTCCWEAPDSSAWAR
jgi:signal transduction protein with GAF and PtsI domain